MGDCIEDVYVQVDEAGHDEQVLRVNGFAGFGVFAGCGDGGDLTIGKGDVQGGVEVLCGVYQAAVFYEQVLHLWPSFVGGVFAVGG